MYRMTKTYGHDLGLSATFRQHRAKSHCRFIHGYALGFKLVFESAELDENGWVKDFGGLKSLKERLCNTFDHKLLVAADDPYRDRLEALMPSQDCILIKDDAAQTEVPSKMVRLGDPAILADVLVLPGVGCEAFARMVWGWADTLITLEERRRYVRLIEVECREHSGNAASYMGIGR